MEHTHRIHTQNTCTAYKHDAHTFRIAKISNKCLFLYLCRFEDMNEASYFEKSFKHRSRHQKHQLYTVAEVLSFKNYIVRKWRTTEITIRIRIIFSYTDRGQGASTPHDVHNQIMSNAALRYDNRIRKISQRGLLEHRCASCSTFYGKHHIIEVHTHTHAPHTKKVNPTPKATAKH